MGKPYLYGSVSAAVMMATAFVNPADAGQIFLTGHDNDFHWRFDAGQSRAAMAGALNFVRAGSTLPVLTFDAGSELTGLMAAMGIPFTNVNPALPFSDSVFNHSIYSAFVVASETSCGGCDNTPADIANITTHKTAIAAFFNAGGGIVGLAGARDPLAYAYVPQTATNPGGNPPTFGYVQTAFGASIGIPAVNGDTTHNFFNEPGTGGLSSAYGVTERLGSATTGTPESIATTGTIVCTPGSPTCTIVGGVPEPGSLTLFGAGLLGIALMSRRRRRT